MEQHHPGPVQEEIRFPIRVATRLPTGSAATRETEPVPAKQRKPDLLSSR
jgi:hypothetical protein